jgi:hypothetical protein
VDRESPVRRAISAREMRRSRQMSSRTPPALGRWSEATTWKRGRTTAAPSRPAARPFLVVLDRVAMRFLRRR